MTEKRFDLIHSMQVKFSKSKRLLYLVSVPLGIAVYALGVLSVFPIPREYFIVVAIFALLFQIGAFVTRQYALRCMSEGEGIRRMAMIQDGLGKKFTHIELAAAGTCLGKNREPAFLSPYYDSPEQPGWRRLVDITAECAHFTYTVTNIISMVLGAIILILIVAALAILLFTSQAIETLATRDIIAKIVTLTITSWAVGDLAAMWMQFRSLSGESKQILAECNGALKAGEVPEHQGMTLFTAYNCAVGQASPLPSWAYKLAQPALNKSWRDSREMDS